MKIIFLYTRLPEYFRAGVQHWVAAYGGQARIVAYPADPDAPYHFADTENIKIVSRSSFSRAADLIAWLKAENPDALYVAGWVDRTYLQAVRAFPHLPRIIGLDNPWTGSLRQRLGAVAYGRSLRSTFTHCWVAGAPQYVFARRLGFTDSRILRYLYCADTARFAEAYTRKTGRNEKQYPRTLLYVGRYVAYKNPVLLARVFSRLEADGKTNGWSLDLVGAGPLKKELEEYASDSIRIQGFTSPDQLPERMGQAGAFCLPSRNEHWGVVIHEAAAAGLPMVLSDSCGAATEFLLHGYNGWLVPTDDEQALRAGLLRLFSATDAELTGMGQRSAQLAQRISQALWAASLMRVLE